jgi:hypothetical protein
MITFEEYMKFVYSLIPILGFIMFLLLIRDVRIEIIDFERRVKKRDSAMIESLKINSHSVDSCFKKIEGCEKRNRELSSEVKKYEENLNKLLASD